jgi:hypothetical protein
MMLSEAALALAVVKFVAVVGSALVTVLFLALVGAKKDDRPAMRTTRIRMKI